MDGGFNSEVIQFAGHGRESVLTGAFACFEAGPNIKTGGAWTAGNGAEGHFLPRGGIVDEIEIAEARAGDPGIEDALRRVLIQEIVDKADLEALTEVAGHAGEAGLEQEAHLRIAPGEGAIKEFGAPLIK